MQESSPSLSKTAISDSEVIRFIRIRAVKYWKTLLFLHLFDFAEIGLGALSPFLVQRFVDALHAGTFLPQLAIGLLGVVIVSKALETCDRLYFEINHLRAAKDFMVELHEHLQALPLNTIKNQTTGEYLARILGQSKYLGQSVIVLYPMLVSNFLHAIVTTVVLFLLEWRLALLTTAVLPVSFFCTRWLNWRQRMAWDVERKNWELLTESLREKLDGMKIIKAFHRGSLFARLFQQDANRWVRSIRRAVIYGELTEAVLVRTTAVFAIVLLIVGAWFALRGWTSIGSVIAFFWYVGNLYGPIQGLVGWNNSKQQMIPVGKRILSLLSMPPEKEQAGLPLPAAPRISLKNISAGYDRKEVLRNVSVEFEPGKMTAVAGESGSGKSTLVSLLLEFNRPTQGEILINGQPLEKYGTRELREGIAFSSSEAFLFNMTIRENITLGGEYTEAEIIEAAKIAGIHEFIAALPQGYDTVVGERGTKLSDGERQRIALARAVIRRPKIFILDEATSGVDSRTESQIYEQLRNLGVTLIVVAHRLSTIYMADRIYLLEGGTVVGQGRHWELLDRCPEYRALFEKQLVGEGTASLDQSPAREG